MDCVVSTEIVGTYERFLDHLTYLSLCPITPRIAVLTHPEIFLIGRPEPTFRGKRY